MTLRRSSFAIAVVTSLGVVTACGHTTSASKTAVPSTDAGASPVGFDLGARAAAGTITFRVTSTRATRVEVWLYDAATGVAERAHYPLAQGSLGVWSATVPRTGSTTVYYGFRAWGPNWPYDATWTPGTQIGFVSDVDNDGNRFNPNKLLFDPYGFELSHDPVGPGNNDGTIFASGPDHRTVDSAPLAPKSIIVDDPGPDFGTKPTGALKDDAIYEVHVRGLTMNDPAVPASVRGTYAGAALKAAYLKDLGITAIELLPMQETQNDGNDLAVGTDGDNYWGYSTLAYFSPDRRYASDKSAGGPTREVRAMVKAFHDAGIKVFADVVYNHTAEGDTWDATGLTTSLFSMRGLDNASYYELNSDPRFFYNNNGVGANFDVANPSTADLVINSLAYWKDVLGMDGFRFDLAAILGNTCARGCFDYEKLPASTVLNRAVTQLPVRPDAGGAGVDLIAEPWAIGDGTYQLGNFPSGWAEWNGAFRDSLRTSQNKLGVTPVAPAELARRFSGSSDLFQDDGRLPSKSINFLVAHDGFTLRDLYSYDLKNNNQPWPFGPSDGGNDNNISWAHGGDANAQRQAARTGFAFLFLSVGVPMITGGDEFFRTQYGNNNAYNLDSDKNWLDWAGADTSFQSFARSVVHFRADHPALRPAGWLTSVAGASGLEPVQWLTPGGETADANFFNDGGQNFLAYRLDGAPSSDPAASLYVAYNANGASVTVTLPSPRSGKAWYRALDTSNDTTDAITLTAPTYTMSARSVLALVER